MITESSRQSTVLISNPDFINYTSNWQNLSSDTSLDLKPFFVIDSFPHSCVLFSLNAVESLLSAENVKTIKAKFCIYPVSTNGAPAFNIVLFSTDSLGAQNSAYFLGTPGLLLSGGGAPGGNIPEWLANAWINHWLEFENAPSFTSGELFSTRYGILNGYNFDMLDILDALYTGKTVDESEYLCIHFALHRHYKEGDTDLDTPTFTFNLILQRQVFGGGLLKEAISDDVYYDISAPSPPY